MTLPFRAGRGAAILFALLSLGLTACDELERRYGTRYELKQDEQGRMIRLDKRTGEVAIVEGDRLVPLKLGAAVPRSPHILWTREDQHQDWLPKGQLHIGTWQPKESFANEADCRRRVAADYNQAVGGGWFREISGGQVMAICLPETVKPPAK